MYLPKSRRRSLAPYGLLSGIQLIIDARGLSTNTNNSYGTVDGSDVVTAIKSISPGPTSRDFTVNGSGVTFNPTNKSIAFNGSGNLRSSAASSTWNFLHYDAVSLGNIKWSMFAVVKLGTSFRPSGSYGIFGTNGSSTANKGAAVYYGNNNTTTWDTLTSQVSRGTVGQYIGRLVSNCIAISNRFVVVGMIFDGGSFRVWIDDYPIIYEENQNNNFGAGVITPTYNLEIGAVGNGVLPLIGEIKEFVLTNSVASYDVSIQFIRGLMNKHNLTKSRSNYQNDTTVQRTFTQLTGSFYYMANCIGQKPTAREVIMSAYNYGTDHTYSAGKKLVGKLSTGRNPQPDVSTFGSQFDIFDPVGSEATQDGGGGFADNGRWHYIVDTQNSGSAGGMVGCYHIYSDDLSTFTRVDLTSLLPADGLAAWRMYGNLIDNNGVLMKPFYKLTDQGNFTNSANYIWRSTDGGATWTAVTVRALSSTYLNEASIIALSSTHVLQIIRNEVTGEWKQFMSTDNGLTWTDQGDITFGETITSANPLMLKSFTHNGVKVIACYYTDRANDVAKVVYGLASALIASGTSGWDLGTKFVWWKGSIADWHYHYGDITHINDTIEAMSQYSYDPYPGSGSGVINKLHYISMPTWHLPLIETELGI